MKSSKKVRGSICLYGASHCGFATISEAEGKPGLHSDGFKMDTKAMRETMRYESATQAIHAASRILRDIGVTGDIKVIEDRQIPGNPHLKVPHVATIAAGSIIPYYGDLKFQSTGVAA